MSYVSALLMRSILLGMVFLDGLDRVRQFVYVFIAAFMPMYQQSAFFVFALLTRLDASHISIASRCYNCI
jgi:hypothetical protein